MKKMKTIYRYNSKNNLLTGLIITLLIIFIGIVIATIIYTISNEEKQNNQISYLIK